ncbi:MAG: GNAT family N-acetyltransferase [Bacteroidota bacterium]
MNAIYNIEKYHPQYYEQWNDFVATAKNATFLFHRDFMEYHKDRFTDFSLLVFKNHTLIALLPAHSIGDTLYSHQGLSYGGFVFGTNTAFKDCLESVKHSMAYCLDHQIKKLHLKLIPRIYHRIPSDEIDYLLFLLEAQLVRRNLSVAVPIAGNQPSADRLQGIKRGIKNKLYVREDTDLTEFWNRLLIPRLQHKFNAIPVHTAEEIRHLKQKFPQNIRQFNVYKDAEIVAGTTIFESHQVARSQYTASNTEKNRLGSLDFLQHYLIGDIFTSKKYFDFGTSNQDKGRRVNEGLLYWKQGYGNGVVTYDFYEVKTENYKKLNPVFT